MFLAPTIKKTKENRCFGLWEPHGGPKGVRAGPGTPILGPKKSKIVHLHHVAPTGSGEPLGCLPRPKTAKNEPLGPLRALGPLGALWSPYQPFKGYKS